MNTQNAFHSLQFSVEKACVEAALVHYKRVYKLTAAKMNSVQKLVGTTGDHLPIMERRAGM